MSVNELENDQKTLSKLKTERAAACTERCVIQCFGMLIQASERRKSQTACEINQPSVLGLIWMAKPYII